MATFSIDYDGTWTSDRGLFAQFVVSAVERGHRVIVTTNRVGAGPWRAEVLRSLQGLPVADVVFAGPVPKREAVRARGYWVDVWIDDDPQTVETVLGWRRGPRG